MRKPQPLRYIFLALLLMVFYNNCAGPSGGLSVLPVVVPGAIEESGRAVCDNTLLEQAYQNSYYSFMRANVCVGCHTDQGPGPALASASIGTAFLRFKGAVAGEFLNKSIAANATNPAHHGAGSPQHASAIASHNQSWSAAVSASCSGEPGGVSGEWTQAYLTAERSQTLAAGSTTILRWDLGAELTPQPNGNFTNIKLSASVRAAATSDKQDGYFISQLYIDNSQQGLGLSGLKVVVNGQVYEPGTTYLNASVDLPPGVMNYPLAVSTLFVPMTRTPADKLAFQIKVIKPPTQSTNGVYPGAGTPTYSTPPLFSELTSPGGVFAVSCAQCHNGVLKSHNLNILDYDNLAPYILTGTLAESSHLYRVVSNRNVDIRMPPRSSLKAADSALVLSWLQAGAPR